MSTYLKFSTIFIIWHAVFKPFGVLHSTVGDDDDGFLNSTIAVQTDKIPRALQLYSQINADSCQSLKKCPDTDELREWRAYCFPGPRQDNQMYHCVLEETSQRFVEFYYPRFPCGEGELYFRAFSLCVRTYTIISKFSVSFTFADTLRMSNRCLYPFLLRVLAITFFAYDFWSNWAGYHPSSPSTFCLNYMINSVVNKSQLLCQSCPLRSIQMGLVCPWIDCQGSKGMYKQVIWTKVYCFTSNRIKIN